MNANRPKLLVFVPAYNAASHIESVIDRIPRDLSDRFDPHLLIIDDASTDDTARVAKRAVAHLDPAFPSTVLANPINQGYGGNQKLGYSFAIEHRFDVVVMIHGDGQYPPEETAALASEALTFGAAFGSRMATRGSAIKGGMPRYKWLGNRILTAIQNRLLGTSLTEFHSGFRAYAIDTLSSVPFQLNSDDFHFDTEIFIQLTRAGVEIGEISIQTHYGDEVCHVNGLSYARNVVVETVKSRIHDSGFFYEMKFDVEGSSPGYESKLDFDSPSTRVASAIRDGVVALDLGSSTGHLAEALREQGSRVIGVDLFKPAKTDSFDLFIEHDLDHGLPDVDGPIDVVLMLDVVEHLRAPERLVAELSEFCAKKGVERLWVSTGNVAFVVQRLAMLLGQFNYGPRGILDMTHTRLFTFRTITRLFRQAGFAIVGREGIPAPIPLAIGRGRLSDFLMSLNRGLIRVLPRMFSYQILITLEPPRPLEHILEDSVQHSNGMEL